jgi:streptomycin 6-kinase
MANKGYHELIGRAINDQDFRAQLLKDPKGVIGKGGYDVPQEFVAKLESIDLKAAEAAISDLEQKFDLKAAW